MTDFQFFMPIAKVDTDKRTVSGYASTPRKDSDGEIVTLDAVRSALPEYMEYGNIREMHALKAVGVASEANIDTKGLYLTAYIDDDDAWSKCQPKTLPDGTEVAPVYKGFSIGGRKLAKEGNKITAIEMTEISIVDRPANPDCRMALAKSAKTLGEAQGYLVKVKKTRTAESRALAKMAKIVGDLAKAGPPAAHDGFSLPAKPGVNVSPKDPDTEVNKTDDDTKPCEAHGKIGCEKCAVEKREFDSKQRATAAASGVALPDGSYPIENISDLENAIQAFGRAKDKDKAKAHIRTRAKALGAEDKLPEKWSKTKSKKAKKLAKAKLAAAFGIQGDSFLTLHKGMNTAGSLAYTFDSIRGAQRSLLMEAKREGGDMKDKALAGKLGTIAKDIASVISLKAEHEGAEALDLSDVDDQYVTTLFGEEFQMAANGGAVQAATSGDPIADAVMALMKRAATPTRMQRMAMASDSCKKARKAAKDAREAVEEVHKMLKANYMAKLAKAGKKPDAKDDDADDFDAADAMGKLQKAYAAINTARDLGKAAEGQLKKAMARSGQRGQEAGDPEAGFFEVPVGVTDLSPAALAGAAPGSKSGGSQPPMYPDDGSVYAGKVAGGLDLRKFAKDGQIPENVAELIMEKARSDGELEALRRMPAIAAGGRRPYAFDMNKIVAGTGGNQQELNKALFAGVDVNAIGGADERAHNEAAAKTAGNFLMNGKFGRNIFDPQFHGGVINAS